MNLYYIDVLKLGTEELLYSAVQRICTKFAIVVVSRLGAKTKLIIRNKSHTRKAVLCTHKSLRAHKSLTHKSRTITSAISRLRAKAGLSRPQEVALRANRFINH